MAALDVHKAAEMGERMLAGSEWQNEDDLVFTQANGRPIDKQSDYDDWCRLLERAGVRHVRCRCRLTVAASSAGNFSTPTAMTRTLRR